LLACAREAASAARPLVIVADVAVLGDSVREQWTRALQFAARGADLRVADGRRLDDALVSAWAARGATDRRRERALEGMRRRALRGEPLGRAPYGYRAERDDAAGGRSRLVPDPAEAPIVRRIFALCVDEGDGIRRIAARLNADGVPTRQGGAWNMASIRDLLRNPVYTGLYRRLGVTIAGAHPALVSAADFRAAERRLVARRSRAAGERRRRAYALSGIARCGYCGARLVGASRPAAGGGEHRYYRCGAASAQGRCRAHTRHADALEDAVLAAIADGVEHEPVLGAPAIVDAAAARVRALQRQLDQMIERRATGQWTAPQFARNATPPALELLTIHEHGAHARALPGGGGHDLEARRRIVDQWSSLNEQERGARLAEIVREIVVTDDGIRVALAH
jgi:hypothetical protein